jgi:Tfp pilus assembly protein PilV
LKRGSKEEKMGMRMLNKKGLTFAELIVTAFVFVTAVVGVLLFFTNALMATQYARDITVAASHGDRLFEEMHSRGTLSNIVRTDWAEWSASQPGDRLPDEAVSVQYTNAAAVPLEIRADVSWTRKSNTYRETFITRMKK